MSWEKKEICIIVKAYPERSRKYGSAICTAGITQEGELIRLYPIDFDYFVRQLRVSKFTWISANVQKTSERLQRKESYKVDKASIKILSDDLTKTQKKGVWEQRNRLLAPFIKNSVEDIAEEYCHDRTSIGIIKPNIKKLILTKPIEEIKITKAKTHESTLDGAIRYTPDRIEKAFKYVFRCQGSNCKSIHKIECEDWELLESFRKWQKEYTTPEILEKKFRERFFDYMMTRDIHFVMGMHSRFTTFMIIGLYYPPKPTDVQQFPAKNTKTLDAFL